MHTSTRLAGYAIAIAFIQPTALLFGLHAFDARAEPMGGPAEYAFRWNAAQDKGPKTIEAAALLLVVSDNTLGLFLGWEGTSVCSFMLIGHWWEEKPNGDAALKAFLGLHGIAGEGSLDPQTRERIALALAQQNSCEYCLSAWETVCAEAQFGGYTRNGGFADLQTRPGRARPERRADLQDFIE